MMTHIYEVTVATAVGDAEAVVPTLREARAFVKEHDVGGTYWIERVEVGKLTARLLCDVINSRGGDYCEAREAIEERRIG